MPKATVHVCPVRDHDVPLKLTSFEKVAGFQGTTLRTIVVCGSPSNAAITACYIPVPEMSTVALDVIATAYPTAGTYLNSGGAYRMQAAIAGSGVTPANDSTTILGVVDLHGNTVSYLVTPLGSADASLLPGIKNGIIGANVVGITVVGRASIPTLWVLDITAVCTHTAFLSAEV